ncbi:polysaccharide biosynthesis/export family protein [Lacimicrobium sp. SS2-24]|uniref:polysaccharide biosynthesis/export family protein n=1 Tax=Lacimicrobium sp. SS2-24 TaxID=2005569 RepID=UPI000B4A8A41|nr:polysaccharide biosynthesis/export family protein [Lacimicrobium sp. SS2-24]
MAIQILIRACLLSSVFVTWLAIANDDRYQIGAGDTLAISVFDEPELAVRTKVPQSGYIQFPLIGQVAVLNKTPGAIATEVEHALLDGYLVHPEVTVTIEAYRPIFIKGAVNRSGRHEFLFDLDVEQAIAIAGGLTDRASRKAWFIVRDSEKIPATASTPVMPGDVIIVEESIF